MTIPTKAEVQAVKDVLIGARQDAYKCSGTTKKGRPCGNPIGAARTKRFLILFDRLSGMSPSEAEKSSLLHDAAVECICYAHRKNVDDIVAQWKKGLKLAVAAAAQGESAKKEKMVLQTDRQTSRTLEPQPPSRDTDRCSTVTEPKTPRRHAASRQPTSGPLTPPTTPLGRYGPSSSDKPSKARFSPKSQGRPYREIESDSETEGRTDSESDDSDDDSEDETPCTPWREYEAKWKLIMANGYTRGVSLELQIPWPVLSGKFKDVNEKNVQVFYEAMVEELGGSETLDSVLHGESQRWAPRNLMRTFSKRILKRVYFGEINAIWAVLGGH